MEPQPALRVTAPSQLSKNEKKAAAGRAGTAARKAKSERLERELAEAKEALRDPAFVADPPAPEAAPIRDKKTRRLYVIFRRTGGRCRGAGLLV